MHQNDCNYCGKRIGDNEPAAYHGIFKICSKCMKCMREDNNKKSNESTTLSDYKKPKKI